MFSSTKRFGPFPTCHRNWQSANNTNRDSTNCSLIHGYSRHAKINFVGELDECNWVFDFGDCKFIKAFFDKHWDHKVLISSDDPELEYLMKMQDRNLLKLTVIDTSNSLDWGPGIEGSCKYVFDMIQPSLSERTNKRVRISKVEIWEHENNSAIYIPTDIDFTRLDA